MADQSKITIFDRSRTAAIGLSCGQADGTSLVLAAPASEAAVFKYFQARMPYGLVVPDVKSN